MTTGVHEAREEHTPKCEHINIHVNKKHVKVDRHSATGAEIKADAIAQGVSIQSDFNLFIIEENDTLKQVGDTERITLHDGERFSATTPDDNS